MQHCKIPDTRTSMSRRSGHTYSCHALLVCLALASTSFALRAPWRISSDATLHVEQLESRMFINSTDMARFRSMCGSNWHRLFLAWEQVQGRALSGDKATKLVVWRCPGRCGGLGDRQRGILTSFTLALVTGRAFFIDSQHPVPLHRYFRLANPNLHWIYNEQLLKGRSHNVESFSNAAPTIGDYASANLSLYDSFEVLIQENNYWRPFSILNNPSMTHLQPLKTFQEHTLAGCMLNYLLVPDHDIQLQIETTRQSLEQADKQMLAVQIRTGDSQAKNTTVLDSLCDIFQACVNDIQKAHQGRYRLFLTSDSEYVVERLSANNGHVLQFAGEISHPDGQFGGQQNPDDSFRKLVLDHIMLSSADQLLISRSGFAEVAALRGFKPYYSPLQCVVGKPVPHYVFPLVNPLAVPAHDVQTVDEVFRLR